MTVALSQIKSALKIEWTNDDAELLRIRDAVVDFISDYTGLSITSKTNTQYISYWMKTRLEEAPFIEIKSVQYYNSSNVLTTMPVADYFLIRSEAPSIYINFAEYPSIKENTEIAINYSTGFAVLPKNIEQAIIALIGLWYNNPEAASPIAMTNVPMSAQFILDELKIKGILT